MKKIRFLVLVVLSLSFSYGLKSFAETIDIHQKNKSFVVPGINEKNPKLSVKKGDTIRFHNDDEFFHNVFSLSDAKLFDLGSYPQGEYRDIIADQTGVIEVECAIHPNMIMSIEVN